jgi:hypothetical protein
MTKTPEGSGHGCPGVPTSSAEETPASSSMTTPVEKDHLEPDLPSFCSGFSVE